MESIILAKNIDVNKITFSDVKTADSGAKSVYINYNGKPLYAQTPEMTCVYGLSKWDNDPKVPPKYSIDLSFSGVDKNPAMAKFMDVLKAMNDKFLNQAMEKGLEWFKKKFSSTEVVEAIYTPLIKYSKDKETGEIIDKYPPTFRLNMPYRDGKVTCPVYDGDKNLIDIMSTETKGAKITAIVRFTGLWMAAGRFGPTIRVEQLRVVAPKVITGFAFQGDDDECVKAGGGEDSDLESEAGVEEEHDPNDVIDDADVPDDVPPKPVAAAPSKPANVPKDVAVEDSDDDDEIEKPKVVKNVARGKKKVAA